MIRSSFIIIIICLFQSLVYSCMYAKTTTIYYICTSSAMNEWLEHLKWHHLQTFGIIYTNQSQTVCNQITVSGSANVYGKDTIFFCSHEASCTAHCTIAIPNWPYSTTINSDLNFLLHNIRIVWNCRHIRVALKL